MDIRHEIGIAIMHFEIAVFLEGRGEKHGDAVKEARKHLEGLLSVAVALNPSKRQEC